MKFPLRTKLVLAFLLVFLAGVACGFFSASHFFVSHTRDSGRIAEHFRRHLERELHLSPQQREQIRPIIERSAARLQQIRWQTGRSVHDVFRETHREIEPLLTSDQRTKLTQMEERHRRRFRDRGIMPPPEAPPP